MNKTRNAQVCILVVVISKEHNRKLFKLECSQPKRINRVTLKPPCYLMVSLRAKIVVVVGCCSFWRPLFKVLNNLCGSVGWWCEMWCEFACMIWITHPEIRFVLLSSSGCFFLRCRKLIILEARYLRYHGMSEAEEQVEDVVRKML